MWGKPKQPVSLVESWPDWRNLPCSEELKRRDYIDVNKRNDQLFNILMEKSCNSFFPRSFKELVCCEWRRQIRILFVWFVKNGGCVSRWWDYSGWVWRGQWFRRCGQENKIQMERGWQERDLPPWNNAQNEGVDSLQTSYGFRGNRQSLRISPRILAESLRILRNFMVLTALDPCEKPLKS